jgi:hypothetical protein
MRGIVLGLGALVGFVAVPQPAFAWGEQGHSAVCELAYRNLTPTTREKLTDLFKAWSERHKMDWDNTSNEKLLYDRFMNSCMFEDDVKHRDELKKFADQPGHFVNYPRTKREVPDGEAVCSRTSANKEVECIFRVLERDLKAFRNENLPKADRAEALIGVGHWLGDIHQPLHVSFKDDIGGGNINTDGACGKSTNLHSVWDTCIVVKGLWEPLRVRENHPRTSNKRSVAHYMVTDWRKAEITPALTAKVGGWVSNTEPWQWAQEGYRYTLNGTEGSLTENLYCYKGPGQCSYSDTQDQYDKKKGMRTATISEAYVTKFAPVVEERLQQAGYRLAWIVNNTLDPAWDRSLPRCSVSQNTCR